MRAPRFPRAAAAGAPITLTLSPAEILADPVAAMIAADPELPDARALLEDVSRKARTAAANVHRLRGLVHAEAPDPERFLHRAVAALLDGDEEQPTPDRLAAERELERERSHEQLYTAAEPQAALRVQSRLESASQALAVPLRPYRRERTKRRAQLLAELAALDAAEQAEDDALEAAGFVRLFLPSLGTQEVVGSLADRGSPASRFMAEAVSLGLLALEDVPAVPLRDYSPSWGAPDPKHTIRDYVRSKAGVA